jgi:hypothetical protein
MERSQFAIRVEDIARMPPPIKAANRVVDLESTRGVPSAWLACASSYANTTATAVSTLVPARTATITNRANTSQVERAAAAVCGTSLGVR